MTIGTVLRSRLDTKSPTSTGRTSPQMQALWDTVATEMASVPTIGGQRYVDRHHARDKMLVRERIERLVDPNTAAARAEPARGVGDAGRGRRRHRQRDRRRREHARRDQRHRHDLSRRVGEPDELAQAATLLRDRQGEPAPADPAQRVRRRRPARARPICSSRAGRASATSPRCRRWASRRSRSRSDPNTAGGAYTPGMSDYTVFVKGRGTAYLGGPPLVKMAIDEIVDEETLGGAEMHSRTSGLSDYLAMDELDGLRIARQIVRHLRWKRLGPGPTEPRRRPALRPGRVDRLRVGRRAHPVRHPRGARPAARRQPVRGVQAAVRRQAGVRLGIDLRLPGRHPRQQRDPLLRGGQEGLAVHPAVQPDEHAAALPAQHHRLHGRLEGGAGRHHRQRGEDDQRRVELDGAALQPDGRRELRRRQLRHGGQGVQPAPDLLVAEPSHRGDGPEAARRRDGDRRPQRRGGAGDRGRRGRDPGADRPRSRRRSSTSRRRSTRRAGSGTTGSSTRPTRER